MKIVVIIPTYNEKENIRPLICSLQEVFKNILHDMNILFVDDNSPDNTAEIILEESRKFANIHLNKGEKKGLGAAYIRGIQYAVHSLKADAIMEMDADFSHKPEDIPRLLAAFDAGADFVIGSRYVKGGSIPEDWAFWRRMNSKWGNFFARYFAGLYKVRDCTAGFRVIGVPLIKKISLSNLKVKGYAFQVALLHRAVSAHAVIKEVPVEFVDRKRGETKLGLADIIEFIINILWIRFDKRRIIVRNKRSDESN
jgi:dolichol-phosphate mannosyltransferase